MNLIPIPLISHCDVVEREREQQKKVSLNMQTAASAIDSKHKMLFRYAQPLPPSPHLIDRPRPSNRTELELQHHLINNPFSH